MSSMNFQTTGSPLTMSTNAAAIYSEENHPKVDKYLTWEKFKITVRM